MATLVVLRDLQDYRKRKGPKRWKNARPPDDTASPLRTTPEGDRHRAHDLVLVHNGLTPAKGVRTWTQPLDGTLVECAIRALAGPNHVRSKTKMEGNTNAQDPARNGHAGLVRVRPAARRARPPEQRASHGCREPAEARVGHLYGHI